MARPHIEFIQSQHMPWQAGLYAGDRGDVQSKTLSLDSETGASSLLIQYPAGWSQPGPEYLRADEELFVLEGGLEINGIAHDEFGFAHLPAGYARQSFSSPQGAVVLTFFSAAPISATGEAPGGLYDASRLVERVDALSQGYGENLLADMGSEDLKNAEDVGLLMLRQDPYDGEQTWLWGGLPFWKGGDIETHPVVEEMFTVCGAIIGDRGTMGAGAYFWRPPNEKHGPYATAEPCLLLFRTKGGPLDTNFTPSPKPFDWDPPYRPILPPGLERHAEDDGWRSQANY